MQDNLKEKLFFAKGIFFILIKKEYKQYIQYPDRNTVHRSYSTALIQQYQDNLKIISFSTAHISGLY